MKLKSLILLFIGIISISCSSMKTLTNGDVIDTKLVGVWEGSEDNQQEEGMSKQWVMTRNANGTFVLDFKAQSEGKNMAFTETGKWWIEEGKFYEFHKESGLTDVYEYTILNKDQIKFKSTKMALEMENSAYEFVDTRKK